MSDEPIEEPAPRRRRVRAASPMPTVRLARLVRSTTAGLSPPSTRSEVMMDGAVVVDVGGARVTAGRGADLTMVMTVVALLRGAGR